MQFPPVGLTVHSQSMQELSGLLSGKVYFFKWDIIDIFLKWNIIVINIEEIENPKKYTFSDGIMV